VWRLDMHVQMQCQQAGELRKMEDFFWLSSPGPLHQGPISIIATRYILHLDHKVGVRVVLFSTYLKVLLRYRYRIKEEMKMIRFI